MRTLVFVGLVLVVLYMFGQQQKLAQNQAVLASPNPGGVSPSAAAQAAQQQQTSPDALYASIFNMIGSFFQGVQKGIGAATDRNG